MLPVLGQRGTNFRTGRPSFSLLSMFPLKSLCNVKSRSPINQRKCGSCKCGWEHRSASGYWEQSVMRAGPVNHRCCPLPLEVSRYAGLYLVSVASLPHHLQATHLVFRPTLAEPKHFLLVTQPPRRAEGREKQSESVDWGKARAEVSYGTNTSRHLSLFPFMLGSSLQ